MNVSQEAKFVIGQTVWAATTTSTRGKWPCPDCHDTQRWLAKTAAGEEIAVQCPRCTGYSSNNLPRLVYQKVETSVHTLTIGSIQMDTAARDGKIYRYMCAETGIGSGQIHYEGDGGMGLYDNKSAAENAAEAMRVAEQAAWDSKPSALEAAAYAELPLNVALEFKWHRDIYDSWAKARYYKEGIEKVLDEDDPDVKTLEDKIWALKDAIDERPWLREHPVQTLINAAKNVTPRSGAYDSVWAAVEALEAPLSLDG